MPVHELILIGPGRLGGALALALSNSGSRISQIIYRSRSRAKSLASKLNPPPTLTSIDKVEVIHTAIVLITVQDEQIQDAVNAIFDSVEKVKAVFHTSGSLSSEILAPLRSKGCSIASLHPLASISNWHHGVQRFKGAYFCLEGDERAVKIGKALVSQLEGRPFTIASKQKPLYHAAALTAAGQVTALFDIAVGFMIKAGVDRNKSRKLLQPLLASIAQNLATEDTDAALTGTYARADKSTMDRHLAALGESATIDEFLVYIELALRSIDLAERAGVESSKLASMRETLMVAKRDIE